MEISNIFLLRYRHRSHDLPIFTTTDFPSTMNACCKTYRHTVSTPQWLAVGWFQWMSLTRLKARGEFLSSKGTQNMVEVRSFITCAALPTILTSSVGRIRPVYVRTPSTSCETSLYWEGFKNLFTSSVAFLKKYIFAALISSSVSGGTSA